MRPVASRWPDETRLRRERRRLRRQLVTIVVLLALLPVAVVSHNGLVAGLVIGAVVVFTIYLRVQGHRIAFPRRRR